jgi:hypothetical protein
MVRDVFAEIESQKKFALQSNRNNADDPNSFIKAIHDFIDKMIEQQSNCPGFSFAKSFAKSGLAIDYHTWAAGVPAHHWMLQRRVIVYLGNPANEVGPGEHIIRRTGANVSFLKELMNYGLVALKLDEKENYSENFVQFLESELFPDNEGVFIYSQLVEDSAITDSTLLQNSSSGSVQKRLIDQLKDLLATGNYNLPNATNTCGFYETLNKTFGTGLVWVGNVQQSLSKVMENFTRIWLQWNLFAGTAKTIPMMAQYSLNDLVSVINGKDKLKIGEESYVDFLLSGTNFYYSLSSGSLMVGKNTLSNLAPYSLYIKRKIQNVRPIKKGKTNKVVIKLDRKDYELTQNIGTQITKWNGSNPNRPNLDQLNEDIKKFHEFFHNKIGEINTSFLGRRSDLGAVDFTAQSRFVRNLVDILAPDIASTVTVSALNFPDPVRIGFNAIFVVLPGIASSILLHLGNKKLYLTEVPRDASVIPADVDVSIFSFPYTSYLRGP